MPLQHLFLATILTALTTSNPILPRAGGPIGKPIPSNCTQTNPLPSPNTTTGQVSGVQPDADFTSANLIYSAYFSEPNLTPAEQSQQCFEQCYGYGEPGDCISALLGFDIPTPAGYYGTSGGQLSTACLMYREFLNPGVFVDSVEGQWVNLTAVDISCPDE